MTNDDLKRFFAKNPNSDNKNDFVRYDENGDLPGGDYKRYLHMVTMTFNKEGYSDGATINVEHISSSDTPINLNALWTILKAGKSVTGSAFDTNEGGDIEFLSVTSNDADIRGLCNAGSTAFFVRLNLHQGVSDEVVTDNVSQL